MPEYGRPAGGGAGALHQRRPVAAYVPETADEVTAEERASLVGPRGSGAAPPRWPGRMGAAPRLALLGGGALIGLVAAVFHRSR